MKSPSLSTRKIFVHPFEVFFALSVETFHTC
jgi:hypothetical protein